MRVREPVILRLVVWRAAGIHRIANHRIHVAAALTGQADQHLRTLASQIAFGVNVLNLASVNSITKMSTDTTMHVAVASMN